MHFFAGKKVALMDTGKFEGNKGGPFLIIALLYCISWQLANK